MTLGEKISELRKESGISQEKLESLNKRIENEIIRQFDEAYEEIKKSRGLK